MTTKVQTTLISVNLYQPFNYGNSDPFVRFVSERINDAKGNPGVIMGVAIPLRGGRPIHFVEILEEDARMIYLVEIDSIEIHFTNQV